MLYDMTSLQAVNGSASQACLPEYTLANGQPHSGTQRYSRPECMYHGMYVRSRSYTLPQTADVLDHAFATDERR